MFPNVDFYSGIILKAIGIPTSMFTVIFALSRTVGWIAHWNEMISNPYKIGRPRQLYSIADAVANADVVLTCVGADKDLEEVYTRPGWHHQQRSGHSHTGQPLLHLPALPRHWHRRPVPGARALSTPRFPAASRVPKT